MFLDDRGHYWREPQGYNGGREKGPLPMNSYVLNLDSGYIKRIYRLWSWYVADDIGQTLCQSLAFVAYGETFEHQITKDKHSSNKHLAVVSFISIRVSDASTVIAYVYGDCRVQPLGRLSALILKTTADGSGHYHRRR